ncbi:sigma 54-interacting transcriptional regulator [Clostridium sp. AL.422]|uniref:sigma 54-interacting transcriptional regulator n=1 Tax=Clostridium TaxID=1485 RepID=UPI00293DC663|nr:MULTISPECIES: sigma 54-interacting transcriptional regulator [unclassified Clostridium]MDV4150852.1 sigma 54-interacting transcriptional regulator [Clostridium sp. AL.422]
MKNEKLEDKIYNFIEAEYEKRNNDFKGITTNYIADTLNVMRPNVSAILNKLHKEGKIIKIIGRPVLYSIPEINEKSIEGIMGKSTFRNLIGSEETLKKSIQQAKAAILYPPKGLHTLLLGPTGVGKTMFAEVMHRFAIENNVLDIKAPFIEFNCADYSNNPQMLLSQLFGYKKGAYTGAENSYVGIVEKADGGILFLDEIHRLPPEGQELLFYLIDKGQFSPMGDAGVKKQVDILIICATTEEKDSALLQTFSRRIPMTINIPSLRERTIKEKFEFISDFFKEEASRVHKELVVKDEVLKSLVSYNCPGNVGQLKSDIKLICANAFIDSLSRNSKKIEVEIIHLPEHVKKGMLYQKEYKKELEDLISFKFISFTNKGVGNNGKKVEEFCEENFYERIEKRLNELNKDHYNEEDIKLIMKYEIEKNFRSYIDRFQNNNIEISKVVSKKVINLVEILLRDASENLKKAFSTKIFYGLCLHIEATIDRLRSGKIIINHNISDIITKYPEEYKICNNFSLELEKNLGVKIPKDEIAYMTMFLSADKIEEEGRGKEPVIIIAMHGRSTATSMAEVVNRLLSIDTVLAYDMSLDKSSQVCYEELKTLIVDKNNGSGVILLVDMGSLSMFGELISNETGIKIRTIELVTTVVALEIARRAETERNIDTICDYVNKNMAMSLNYGSKLFNKNVSNKENVIVTVCITGEGSAMRIKALIEDNIDLDNKNIEIIPIAISEREEMNKRISKILKSKRIVAIVGSIDPGIHSIPFISLTDLVMFNRYDKIRNIIKSIDNIRNKVLKDYEYVQNQIFDEIRGDLEILDIETYKKSFNIFLENVVQRMNIEFDLDMFIALTFHMTCAINSIIKNNKRKSCKRKIDFKIKYQSEMDIIKESLRGIEKLYSIDIDEDEICFILMIIKRI